MKLEIDELEIKSKDGTVFVKFKNGDEVEITENKTIWIRDNNGNTKFYLEW